MVSPVNTRLFSTQINSSSQIDTYQTVSNSVGLSTGLSTGFSTRSVLKGQESQYTLKGEDMMHLLSNEGLNQHNRINPLFCRDGKRSKNLVRIECNGIPETIEVKDSNPVFIPAEQRIKEVIQDIRPSVVGLQMTGKKINDATGREEEVGWVGSGFVISNEDLNLYGYEPLEGETLIATNFHVADGADQMEMTLFDGSIFSGKVKMLVSDEDLDIAILVVDTDDEILDPVPIGSIGDIDQGEFVLAFGQPYGLPFRVTSGIINNANFDQEGVIQTDAAINPGNSGGPLVDLSTGHVVGMNSFIYKGANNMGFALPIWMQFEVLREAWEEENYVSSETFDFIDS